ncbi:MAG: glycosyltransferase family 9 protein [Leptospirales bacterium]
MTQSHIFENVPGSLPENWRDFSREAGQGTFPVALDCRHYIGDRPCRFGRPCEGCTDYSPQGFRILVLKTGALGDVLRTTILLGGIRRAYPHSHITWITAPEAVPLVPASRVDRIWTLSTPTLFRLHVEHFDLVLSLDKEPEVAALAMVANAPDKRGMGVDGRGAVYPLNPEMAYYYRLGLDNPEKFHGNRRSYPDLLAEAVRIPYDRETDDYHLDISEKDLETARRLLAGQGLSPSDPIVALNTGAGGVFVNKDWTVLGYLELIRELEKARIPVLLLGGDRESSRNAEIARKISSPYLREVGSSLSLGVFSALVSLCRVVVTGDTLGMHVALATGRPVVAIFGSTQPHEIELFGRGEKVVTPLSCAPCYRRTCDIHPSCMEVIDAERVCAAVMRQIDGAKASLLGASSGKGSL